MFVCFLVCFLVFFFSFMFSYFFVCLYVFSKNIKKLKISKAQILDQNLEPVFWSIKKHFCKTPKKSFCQNVR